MANLGVRFYELAASLTSLGNRFSELGRPAEALPVTEEAVTILRELAAAHPVATAPTSPAP